MNRSDIELDISYHVESSAFKVEDDSERFYEAARWIAKRYDLRALTASISIVDDPTIHRLNRDHLQHDWPTDVISFVFENEAQCVDGEIIASYDTAERFYKKAGWRLEDEILLYVVHGLLHLAGMDDIESDDRQAMRNAEQECLIAMNVQAAKEHLARWEEVF